MQYLRHVALLRLRLRLQFLQHPALLRLRVRLQVLRHVALRRLRLRLQFLQHLALLRLRLQRLRRLCDGARQRQSLQLLLRQFRVAAHRIRPLQPKRLLLQQLELPLLHRPLRPLQCAQRMQWKPLPERNQLQRLRLRRLLLR